MNAGLTIKGTVASVHGLPWPPQAVCAGDTYVVGSDLYAWDGRQWNYVGPISGPTGGGSAMKQYTLTYNGVSATIRSSNEITSLFFDPDNLDMDDLAIFETTYPEEFKQFREGWAHKWAVERAKEEFDEWELDYYEKKPKRDYP